MEWKRVKSALIILFLIVDVFLAYKVYQKNIVTNSDTLDALNSILTSRSIDIEVNVKDIEIQSKMSKLLITSDSGSEGGSSTIGKYLTASNFTQNASKNPAYVVNSDEEGYVDLTFTQKSSGLFVKSESFTDSSTGCQLVMDDITITTNGTPVSTIAKCGFYTTDSQYSLADGALLQVSSEGVQFNTSSSCTGPYPIVIHMKAKLLFS